MKYAKVQFTNKLDQETRYEQETTYVYKIPAKMSLAKYDTVLVNTRYGYALATVVELADEQNTVSEGRLLSIAEKIKSKTLDNVNKLKKADEIKKALDKKIKQVDETQKYKMYADLDPEIATLIKELESLRG